MRLFLKHYWRYKVLKYGYVSALNSPKALHILCNSMQVRKIRRKGLGFFMISSSRGGTLVGLWRISTDYYLVWLCFRDCSPTICLLIFGFQWRLSSVFVSLSICFCHLQRCFNESVRTIYNLSISKHSIGIVKEWNIKVKIIQKLLIILLYIQ